MYEVNAVAVKDQWSILCFGYQWLGDKTKVVGLPEFGWSEKKMLSFLHSLLDQAQIVVAQNGDSFDIPKINSRLLVHGFKPPSPYRTVDTLKISRNIFGWASNKLDDVGKQLNEGEKIKHRGFDMWLGCMARKMPDWKDMMKYCGRDVDLLARIYKRYRPWHKTHPVISDSKDDFKCKRGCGGTTYTKRGYIYTQTLKYERRQCKKCGGWGRATNGTRITRLTNA